MKLEYDSKYFMNKAIEEAQMALSKGLRKRRWLYQKERFL